MTPKMWFLCAACAESIKYNLRLREMPSADVRLSKHKCDMCGKTKEGSVYRVEEYPKGERQ